MCLAIVEACVNIGFFLSQILNFKVNQLSIKLLLSKCQWLSCKKNLNFFFKYGYDLNFFLRKVSVLKDTFSIKTGVWPWYFVTCHILVNKKVLISEWWFNKEWGKFSHEGVKGWKRFSWTVILNIFLQGGVLCNSPFGPSFLYVYS